MSFLAKCLHCEKPFEAKTRNQKFDTRECCDAYRKKNDIAKESNELIIAKCIQCSKAFRTKSPKQQLCSKDCAIQHQVDNPKQSKQVSAWTPYNLSTQPTKKNVDQDVALSAITDFVNAIDAIGGIVKCDENTYVLAAYDESYGIADAYLKGCKVIDRFPKIVDHSMKDHSDCIICGGITANKAVMSCKHKDHVCSECKSLSPEHFCHKCEDNNLEVKVA